MNYKKLLNDAKKLDFKNRIVKNILYITQCKNKTLMNYSSKAFLKNILV